jgi:tripartite-type tricarboxylate transporter receptor subunit TctC
VKFWLSLLIMMLPALAAAQSYPTRAIRFVVPFPAGAGPDIMARLFAESFSKRMGQPVYVENKPGATANIGAHEVAKSAPDGYSVLYGFNQIATINPHLFKKLPYDVNKDLMPVTLLMGGPYAVLASQKLPANTLPELIALAKKEPGKINFGSYGPGSTSHLGLVMIEDAAGISMLHVPYKSGVLNDLVAGVVSLTIEPVTTSLPWIKDGRLKAIATTGTQRVPGLPNVPTMAESHPGLSMIGWQGIWVPAGTPQAIVAKLNKEFHETLREPTVVGQMQTSGLTSMATSPEQMQATIRQEFEAWGKLIRSKNIQLD